MKSHILLSIAGLGRYPHQQDEQETAPAAEGGNAAGSKSVLLIRKVGTCPVRSAPPPTPRKERAPTDLNLHFEQPVTS